MKRRRDDRFRPTDGLRRFTGIEALEGRRLLSTSPVAGGMLEERAAARAAIAPSASDVQGRMVVDPAPSATTERIERVRPPSKEPEEPATMPTAAPSLSPLDSTARPEPVETPQGIRSPTVLAPTDNYLVEPSEELVVVVMAVVETQTSSEPTQAPEQEPTPVDPRAVPFAAGPFAAVHEVPAADHAAPLPLQPVPFPTGDAAGNGSASEAQLRSGPNPGMLGNLAENSFQSAGALASGNDIASAFRYSLAGRLEHPTSAPEQAVVSHLVALNNSIGAWAAGATLASVLTEATDWDVAATTFEELLVPRFAFDDLTLGAALSDFWSDADELGVSLLSLLSDPVACGEAALLTGILAAGIAHRQWRGSRGREDSDAWRLLSARFIRGPELLRGSSDAGE